jgi:L-threonylcarbamoyladenylate synthase
MTDNYAGKNEMQIKEACKYLRSGGVVAFPTDTVFGLGSDVFNEDAIKKIYAVKNRPETLPLPVLVCDMHQLRRLVTGVTPAEQSLIDCFWPGGLTIIMRKSPAVPYCVTAGDETVAVRMPDHSIPLMIMKEMGVPIIGTSANVSGKPSPLRFEDVESQLGSSVDYIVRSNTCRGGKESTVVDITSGFPIIVRKGIVSEEAIRNAVKLS